MVNKPIFARDPEKGLIAGVCAGIARYFDVPVGWVRVIAVLLLFISSVIPMMLYVVAWLFLDKAGSVRIEQPSSSAKFANVEAKADVLSPKERLQSVATQIESAERRIEQLEHFVISDAFRLHREFRDL